MSIYTHNISHKTTDGDLPISAEDFLKATTWIIALEQLEMLQISDPYDEEAMFYIEHEIPMFAWKMSAENIRYWYRRENLQPSFYLGDLRRLALPAPKRFEPMPMSQAEEWLRRHGWTPGMMFFQIKGLHVGCEVSYIDADTDELAEYVGVAEVNHEHPRFHRIVLDDGRELEYSKEQGNGYLPTRFRKPRVKADEKQHSAGLFRELRAKGGTTRGVRREN